MKDKCWCCGTDLQPTAKTEFCEECAQELVLVRSQNNGPELVPAEVFAS